VTDDLTQKIDEEKKVNRLEEERFRKLAQMNAALKAKLEFIESKYDFTTNVNHLNSDDFKSLMNTNEMVNNTMGDFLKRLEVIKTEVSKYEAMKFAL
jgi:hypothetical protein